MLQAVKRLILRRRVDPDPAQLAFALDARPRTAAELLANLRARGLRRITRCTLTKNARVMVSFRGTELRVHEGYLEARPDVLEAIVRLIEGRTKAIRREAAKFVVANSAATNHTPVRRRERTHPDDAEWSTRLLDAHRRLNERHFGGALGTIDVRVSRRMQSRLGHYSPRDGELPAEIAISRRHIRRHGWDDATETLLHEMVHQWQAESGMPVDHGREFRRKAREVGMRPRAKRAI
jgi:hypothetical protein